jgi:hypothetical protein
MERIKEIKDTNGEFKKQQKTKIGRFINLCKYDIVPAMLTGSVYSFIYEYEAVLDSNGPVDNMIMGGMTGAALALAVNGVIAAASKINEDKEKGKKL